MQTPFSETHHQIIDAQKASFQKESIVIIHDNLMFCVGSMAGDLGLPSIIVRNSSSASSSDSDSESDDEAQAALELQTLETELSTNPANYDAHVQVCLIIFTCLELCVETECSYSVLF